MGSNNILIGGLAALLLGGAFSGRAFAHGETARGGGSGALNTVGAAIAPQSGSVAVRFELRQFSSFADDELLRFAVQGEDVHQHSQEMSAFLASSWAFTDWLGLDLSIPVVNLFRNFREGVMDGGEPRLEVDDLSAGIGDLLILSRFRPYHDGPHHLALLGGIKLPTGMTRETNNEGERLGAHNQPGSGSIDFQVGAAYTYVLGDLQFSADVIASIRTDGATAYQAGNLLQIDAGIGYRLFGIFTPLLEVNAAFSERDIEEGEILVNSGIRTVYVSPGLMVEPAEGHAIYATASIPVLQALPGIQNDEIIRASIGYSASFGWGEEEHEHDHDHGEPHEH